MATAYSLLLTQDVDTYSEEWRHECECRHLAKSTTAVRRHAHEQIVKRRGEDAGVRIKRDVMTLRLMRDLWRLPDDEISERWSSIVGRYGSDVAERALENLRLKRRHDARID